MPETFLSSIGAHPAWNMSMVVLLLKATLILIAALGVTFAMQRASAGARHLVWLVALGTLLVVPAISAWAPLRVEILPPLRAAAAESPSGTDADVRNDASGAALSAGASLGTLVPEGSRAALPANTPPVSGSTQQDARSPLAGMSALSILATIWIAVMLLIAASLAWSALVVRRIVRQAKPLDSIDWRTPLFEVADRLGLDEAPRLLRSEDAKMPFACGVFAPTIVLPAECDGWTHDRRTAVLLHELAHVRRHDLVGHTLGRLACALYWFHPLVWTAAKNLRAESERACDDLALACGTRATDYAEHLLEIVTSVRGDATPAVALAMARRKEFEGRMLAILDPELRHSTPSRLQSAGLFGARGGRSLNVGAAAPARRATVEPATSAALRPQIKEHVAERIGDSTRNRTAEPDRNAQPAYPNDFSGEPRTNVEQRTNVETKTNVVTSLAQQVRTAMSKGMAAGASVADAVSGTSNGRDEDSSGAEALALIASAQGRKGQHLTDDRPALLAKILRTDTSAALRRIAAWGLSEYADTPVATQALAEAVKNDKDEDVREMAAWALSEASDRGAGVGDALAVALKDKSEKVRATAAWALGEVGSRGSVEALVAALGDQSKDVRRRALWALGEIGPKQAPKQVIAMLKDSDPEVRELAAWALYEMEDADAAPALEAALKTETNKDLQLAYIRALASIGEKSVDALRGLLESPDPKIKTMAVKALAGGDAAGPWPWPWPEPRPYPEQ
jgi:beta-lactamase regulating signal transducer with metallopeptidase domain/HEAT repeat protein